MKTKILFLIIPIILIIGLILVILPPSFGKLPEDHSLNEKTYIEVNGAKIGLIILSDNVDNPVLIVCGGGPGIPQYLMESLYPSVLPEYFTDC